MSSSVYVFDTESFKWVTECIAHSLIFDRGTTVLIALLLTGS